MLLLHKSLKRSDDIMRSFRRFCEVDFKTIDGVVEVFNNNKYQGYVIKLFQSYNENNDLAIWIFESQVDKNIVIAYSTRANIDDVNNWKKAKEVNCKSYPIKAEIKRKIISDMHQTISDYYGLNEEIEKPKSLQL